MSLDLVASSMTAGPGSEIDRPVLNETGLTGTYDVAIEFAEPSPPAAAGLQRSSAGPNYIEALRDQIGLRLEPRTGQVTFLVVDYIQEPPAN